MANKLIRLAQVLERVGCSTSTLLRMESTGAFPKRRRIQGNKTRVWLESEVDAWISQQSNSGDDINSIKLMGEKNEQKK